jgi:hypothetical protein
MDDSEPVCDRCGHVWDAHSDRAFIPCMGANRCGCTGWSRILKPEGF